jgi:hypothetical protein
MYVLQEIFSVKILYLFLIFPRIQMHQPGHWVHDSNTHTIDTQKKLPRNLEFKYYSTGSHWHVQ